MLDFCLILTVKKQYIDESNFIQKNKGLNSYKYQFSSTKNYNFGGMQLNEPKQCLSTKIRCGIFKDLFNQIEKNIKTDKQFYMFLCKTGIKMTFMESGKQVEIQVILNSQVFHLQYDYYYQVPKLYKFSIKDMQVIGVIFQNPSITLNLAFTEDQLRVSYQNQFSGDCVYKITPMAIDEDQIPKQIGNIERLEENQDICTKIKISKSKMISCILATISLLKKYECIQIQFISNQNKINIVPVPSNYGIKDVTDSKTNFKIPVVYQSNPKILDPIRFELKKIKAALVFYDKNQQIILTLTKSSLKAQSANSETKQKKNIMILIAAYSQ